jgi:hypothetical protein
MLFLLFLISQEGHPIPTLADVWEADTAANATMRRKKIPFLPKDYVSLVDRAREQMAALRREKERAREREAVRTRVRSFVLSFVLTFFLFLVSPLACALALGACPVASALLCFASPSCART